MKGPESKFQIVKFITETHHNIAFVGALLLKEEIKIFNQVYNQHTHLLVIEHNALLDTLSKRSGWSKIACIVVTPGESNTERVVIVLLPSDI